MPISVNDIGKFGDYTYFSLHKHFPISNGSILISKQNEEILSADEIFKLIRNNENLRKTRYINSNTLVNKRNNKKYTGSIFIKSALIKKKNIDKNIEYVLFIYFCIFIKICK